MSSEASLVKQLVNISSLFISEIAESLRIVCDYNSNKNTETMIT